MTGELVNTGDAKPKDIALHQMTREQIELIKDTVAKGATDNELKLFLYTASRTGLDPLTKQIHFIKRRTYNKYTREYEERGTIQTGIDGYRVVASRNGLAGIDDAIFDSEDKEHPNKATVTVYRNVGGTRVPFTASARWTEYVQESDEYENGRKTGRKVATAMWKKMPYLMLAKVAEALALRKAFPNDLTGIYTNEEMDQAEPMKEIDTPPARMESYTVERTAPPSDDEAGGNTEKMHAQAEQDEINEGRKERIKALLYALDKPVKKAVVKELTGLDMEPVNYEVILEILQKKIDSTDAITGEEIIIA